MHSLPSTGFLCGQGGGTCTCSGIQSLWLSSMLGLCTAETVVCWAYHRRRSWNVDIFSLMWALLSFLWMPTSTTSVGDRPLMGKEQPSQPGRRHGKGHVQMCSWMQLVTGQRRLKSVVAVHCALQATLTQHVRNALCASVSVLSETVSSSIMAYELVSDVATLVTLLWILLAILWHCFVSIFIFFNDFCCVLFISEALNCSLTVMYWGTAYIWTAYMNWFLTLPYYNRSFEFHRISIILWHCFLGIFIFLLIFAVYFYIIGTKLQFNCYVLEYCLYLTCIYELISNTAILQSIIWISPHQYYLVTLFSWHFYIFNDFRYVFLYHRH